MVLATMATVPLGCSGYRQAERIAEPLRLHDAAYPDVMRAAEEALGGMHFAIEKRDTEQGIIRTQPLRGAQLFEFWRSDNAGLHDAAEANLHSIRRIVELRITEEQGLVSVDCHVQVQRLSLPENEVASVSQAFQMHSTSIGGVQTLRLGPKQRQRMAWIDLEPDDRLALRILKTIARKVQHSGTGRKT
ncbi:MAG: hypothetical protein JW955_00125 [Sedimentisphaerales bacterium]|nr:hypothetical protein [Sedimentisphaerales bacterium]